MERFWLLLGMGVVLMVIDTIALIRGWSDVVLVSSVALIAIGVILYRHRPRS